MNGISAWDQATNVLAVRLDALGDVLMTTPALRALKESRPGRRVTLLTSPAGAEVAGLVPEIDEVLVYDAPWMKATAARADSRPEFAMVERLRQGGFDAAAIFTVSSQNPLPSALLCFLADIPLRLAHCRENPYQLLTHWIRDPDTSSPVCHEVRRQLDLVAAIGCHTLDEHLSLRFSDSARSSILAHLDGFGIDRSWPWIVVHPGASAPSRRYPPELFARAARLLAESGYPIVFAGSPSEGQLVQQLQALVGASSYSLAGRLSLEELAALLATAPLLISNNSGPAHVAAAVGTPIVDLYALTNPQHTPWAVPNRVLFHDVPCKYCYKSICPQSHHDCLCLVTPESVAAAAHDLLAETFYYAAAHTRNVQACATRP